MPRIDVYATAGTFADPRTLAQRLRQAPVGGWGLWGHAHTNAELVAAARTESGKLSGARRS